MTIPPVTWTNAAHRHGVIMLGTFIVEEAHLLEEVLSSDACVTRTIDALVLATKNFGFDGWLLNIECKVDADKIPTLKHFVRTLSQRIHDEIAHGTVIWYDSVIEDGSLKWQNEVNEKNVQLYEGTDGILLNYCWTDKNLEQTAKQLNNDPVAMANVFVGIDIFSRSQKAGFDSVEVVPFVCSLEQFQFLPIGELFIPLLARSQHQKCKLFRWNFCTRLDLRNDGRHRSVRGHAIRRMQLDFFAA